MNTIITDSSIDTDSTRITASTRRLWVILSAALAPVTLSVLLTGIFYLFGDYRVVERVPAETEFAGISYPQKSKPVGTVFTAKGVLTSLPENTTLAYLMVKRDQHYWPKKLLGNQFGEWAKEISEPKKKNSRLSVVVLAMDVEGKAIIDQWYATSQQTGKYPGIAEIATAKEIAAVEVKQ